MGITTYLDLKIRLALKLHDEGVLRVLLVYLTGYPGYLSLS